ncbi:hypothetical protein OSH11_15050 [Kaistia dalseonensis]|uniref:Uncharacterized protein n=1 Tax=Kaistia dalseonensis TaxID=410840 RepID=A0ABU0H8J6_9HYPH|nr:hypothetical protein [Kaistia dalseonensis]MCX5496030.1 hypothetical protein [Kaistia dalseonensis]MDQ0438634.1 hypothetical protein [Kaistia dalseonensis]
MRNLLMTAAALALIAQVTPAFAADQIEGTVLRVSPATGMLQLQTGETFQFSNGAVLYGLLPGQQVGVTYSGSHGIGAFNPHPESDDNSSSY